MSRILMAYATAAAAVVAIALAFVGSVGAQEEQQEQQQNQNADQQSEQQKSQDQQNEQQKSEERERQEQQASQQEQESSQEQKQREQQQQAEQQRQRAEQQREQADEQRRQQQEQQRANDDQQRGRTERWRDRDESTESRWNERRESPWPQPDGDRYGSDSLEYRGDRSQSGEQQGGLGVGLTRDEGAGVLVASVNPGSPAEEMGIREGDRITQVNGREVQSVQQFISRIRGMEPGQQVELDIRRAAGGERTVSGELESREEALAETGERRGFFLRRGFRDSDDQDRTSQTRYEEDSRTVTSQRGGRMSADRLDQLERQVDRMSREIQQLRYALQDARRSSSSGQAREERTAGYDEYQRTDDWQRTREGRGDREYRQAEREGSQSASRYDGESGQPTREYRSDSDQGSDRYQSSDRGRSSTRTGSDSDASESRDRFDEGPGGEVGEDRLHVGSENVQHD